MLFINFAAHVCCKAKGAAAAPPTPCARPPTYSENLRGLPEQVDAGHAAEACANFTVELHAGKKLPQGPPADRRQAADGTNQTNCRGDLP